ncbi:MAG: SDR family NAD(P)-dependent oxidoreductase [Verrucomicrobia bacterium]|nr:SDR family NAD(P)-dependent oxidoreductase [Verrucomicrobiota bacterium]
MAEQPVMVITGTRKGIGRSLAEHYCQHGYHVVGCSREPAAPGLNPYTHFCLDVVDEVAVARMFFEVQKRCGRLDVLVNNAGIASMNHCLLTPLATVRRIYETNVLGTFLFCREAAKLMQPRKWGRIVNFATVAAPLKLEGEAAYASSKAAVANLTEILARELAPLGITVNAVGPTPVKTDLIRSVPAAKMQTLLRRQAIQRFGEFADIANVVDFFLQPSSDFVTGQVIYLGGV